jgi:hypothetical protein
LKIMRPHDKPPCAAGWALPTVAVVGIGDPHWNILVVVPLVALA